MPEFTSYPAGTPSWVDHAAKDLSGSNSFYSNLFGWEAEDQGEEMGHYTILRKNGKTVAGNMAVTMEGQPSAWVSYVSVADADATADLAKKAGGAVFVEPMDVSDIGRMADLRRPQRRRHRHLATEDLPRCRAGQRAGLVRLERAQHPDIGPRPRPSTPRCSGGTPTTWTWVK